MVDIPPDKLIIHTIVNSFKASNTFVIEPINCENVWLIDVGDVSEILKLIQSKKVAGIFITHAHLDHIYGIREICAEFTDCKVYGSQLCLRNLFDDKANLSFYYERPLGLTSLDCCELTDNAEINLTPQISIKCVFTPGHTEDSVCYLVGNNLFTGDAYIPGIPVVTKLKGGNKELANHSLSLIKTMESEGCNIYPGHTL